MLFHKKELSNESIATLQSAALSMGKYIGKQWKHKTHWLRERLLGKRVNAKTVKVSRQEWLKRVLDLEFRNRHMKQRVTRKKSLINICARKYSSHKVPCQSWKDYSVAKWATLAFVSSKNNNVQVPFEDALLSDSGAFGRVYNVRKKNDNQIQVMKIVRRDDETNGLIYPLQRMELGEAMMHAMLHHPHIVKCNKITLHPDTGNVVLLMQKYDMSVQDYKEQTNLAPMQRIEVVLLLLWQVGHALTFLHGQGIVHRDVKSSNIFVSLTDNTIHNFVLADLGFARFLTIDEQLVYTDTTRYLLTFVGSAGFMAPELQIQSSNAEDVHESKINHESTRESKIDYKTTRESKTNSQDTPDKDNHVSKDRDADNSKKSKSSSVHERAQTKNTDSHLNDHFDHFARYSTAVDVYGLGATAVHLLTGQEPNHSSEWNSILNKWLLMMEQQGETEKYAILSLGPLLVKMISPDPTRRPTAHQLIVYIRQMLEDDIRWKNTKWKQKWNDCGCAADSDNMPFVRYRAPIKVSERQFSCYSFGEQEDSRSLSILDPLAHGKQETPKSSILSESLTRKDSRTFFVPEPPICATRSSWGIRPRTTLVSRTPTYIKLRSRIVNTLCEVMEKKTIPIVLVESIWLMDSLYTQLCIETIADMHWIMIVITWSIMNLLDDNSNYTMKKWVEIMCQNDPDYITMKTPMQIADLQRTILIMCRFCIISIFPHDPMLTSINWENVDVFILSRCLF